MLCNKQNPLQFSYPTFGILPLAFTATTPTTSTTHLFIFVCLAYLRVKQLCLIRTKLDYGEKESMKCYSTLIMYFTTLLIFICCEEWESEPFFFSPILWNTEKNQRYSPSLEGTIISVKKILRLHAVTSLQKGQKNNGG